MPMTSDPEERGEAVGLVVVGQVGRAHGTRGEVAVRTLTDHPDSTFVPGVEFRLSPDGIDPQEGVPPLRIERARPHRGGVLVHFQGVEDRGAAELLRGRYLQRPLSETRPLEEGELFLHQLIGMRVRTSEGEEIGEVRAVYELEPAELLEVTGPGRTHLIPFTRGIVLEWSVPDRQIVIAPPPGLLEL